MSTQEPLWPMMTREQWSELLDAAKKVGDMMRVHLGPDAVQWRLLDLALCVAFEELERRVEERRAEGAPF